MKGKNIADKYKEKTELIDPMGIAELNKNELKEVKLEYKEIKSGHAIVIPHRLFDNGRKLKLVDLNGACINLKSEEIVFKVLKSGKNISEYAMKVNKNDLITVSPDGIYAIYHKKNTTAEIEGTNIDGCFIVNLEAITAIVEYNKI